MAAFRATRGRFAASWLIALTLLLPGCGSDGTSSDATRESRPPTSLDWQGEWLFPPDGLLWQRAEILALVALPLDTPPASVRVILNDQDVTERFLPVTVHNRVIQGSAGNEEDDSMERVPRALCRSVQAILRAGELASGDNTLIARFSGSRGEEHAIETRFTMRPGQRRIRARVRRQVEGRDVPGSARIVVIPEEGSPAVDFSEAEAAPGLPWVRTRRRNFTFARAGEAEFFLPEGAYTVIATGGPLDSIDMRQVPARGDADLDLVIRREVQVPGMVTADFHVHAAPSPDSFVPLEERLWSFLAGGVEVLVASDHDIVTDHSQLAAYSAVNRQGIQAIPGVEISVLRPSGASLGHWNVWPLLPDPSAAPIHPAQVSSHGALPLPPVPESPGAGRAMARIYESYRALPSGTSRQSPSGDRPLRPLIQLNHPRGIQFNPHRRPVSRVHAFFDELGFLPREGIPPVLRESTETGTTPLDFDALEVWNRSSRQLYQEVREDWFALLNAGYRPTGTANTDSHTLSTNLAGYPVNLVDLSPLAPSRGSIPVAALVEAVGAGRVVGTDGPVPLLQVSAGESSAGPGQTVTAPDGRVTARVSILAAGWVPVGETRLWINGEIHARTRERELTVTLDLEKDAWLVAEVGDLEGVPEDTTMDGLYGILAPRGMAVGFTNPVRVVVDPARASTDGSAGR